MDSVDYNKQLNRKEDLYRRDIKKANSDHADNLDTVKSASAHKVKQQSDAYDKQRKASEESFKNTISDMRSSQAKSLSEKNKQYREAVEDQQNTFSKVTKNNIKDWNQRFNSLKSSYDKDLTFQKEKNSQNDKSLKESHAKDRFEMEKRHQNQKLDLFGKDFEKKDRMREYTTNAVDNLKADRERSYIEGRDLAAAKFEKLSDEVNTRQKDFSENELKRVKQAATEGIAEKNRVFGEKFTAQEQAYNNDVRAIQRRIDAEKVSQNDTRKDYDERIRNNQQNQFDQRKEVLLNQNVANTKFYNNKMTELKEMQQDELHQERIRNAVTIAKEKEARTLALQDSEFKNKVTQDKANHESTVRLNLERSENQLKQTRAENHKDTEINNLKSDFTEGIRKARIANKEGMDELKQESVMEKRDLEKRLRNQSYDNTTQLKNIYNTKYENMKHTLETKILSLQNDNASIQRGAVEMVNNIRIQSAADLEQQKAASEQKLNDLLLAERDSSQTKENSLKKTLRETQADFTRRMNELTQKNQIKMKELSSTLVGQAKQDVAKQQEETQLQKRYFTREIERLTNSSNEEREALITQYDERIKQMQQIYAEKISEIKSFNKLENA